MFRLYLAQYQQRFLRLLQCSEYDTTDDVALEDDAMRKRRKFEIAASYDTETTNIGEGEDTRAFPVLFIDNRIVHVDLRNYEPERDDDIRFYRHEEEMMQAIRDYIKIGQIDGKVPIICAYNLMFDLQPLMELLDSEYDMQVNAQSSTNVYTIDLYEQDTDNMLLRFWDTYHLEMRGLAAMGETAGLPKAIGDWNYDLIRTPDTELSDDEKFYAGRDTQVIPMYLRYLLRSNEWMKQEDFGNRVLTKTSIVRQMARREIGRIQVGKHDGKKLSLDKAFMEHCKAEDAHTFAQYALRKACFRGGFTFTAAATASMVVHNVVSLDVTSMHHTFINGRLQPEEFVVCSNHDIEVFCKRILNTKLEEILSHYEKPFDVAIHARVKLTNVRIRKGTCFDEWGIALEPASKFKRSLQYEENYGEDARNVEADNYIRSYGWHDVVTGGKFAFGKLYAAKEVIMNLSELELWCMGQVYEWDSLESLFGEASAKFRVPPDFVTLQSNELFEMKSAAKFISKHYNYGEPYKYNLSGIPDGIAKELQAGTCNPQFFESWYTGTVKGMFNGIYGTQAQDVRRPSYKVQNGELVIDDETRVTAENYDEHKPGNLRVLYTYGLRIVGGSRLHMVISMELLHRAMGTRCRVLGGDTDSMKCACDADVTDDELEAALEPIAVASKNAINVAMRRVRKTFPKMASTLNGIGSFDIENRGHHYDTHIELWNKCRVSFDGKAHVTCAGLRRPIGQINMETVITELAKHYPIDYVLQETIGYNVFVEPSVSHALEKHQPRANSRYDKDVTDCNGITRHVTSHQSPALYPAGRWLGETLKATNLSSVTYLRDVYGREVDTTCRYVGTDGNRIWVKRDGDNGIETIMECEVEK